MAPRGRLLMAQYQSDYGAKTALPPAALAMSAVNKGKRDPAGFTAANLELEQVIARKHRVEDRDLEQLGQSRARAIQDALLGAGTVDAARVFVMGANPAAPTENRKVRVELSLK